MHDALLLETGAERGELKVLQWRPAITENVVVHQVAEVVGAEADIRGGDSDDEGPLVIKDYGLAGSLAHHLAAQLADSQRDTGRDAKVDILHRGLRQRILGLLPRGRGCLEFQRRRSRHCR